MSSMSAGMLALVLPKYALRRFRVHRLKVQRELGQLSPLTPDLLLEFTHLNLLQVVQQLLLLFRFQVPCSEAMPNSRLHVLVLSLFEVHMFGKLLFGAVRAVEEVELGSQVLAGARIELLEEVVWALAVSSSVLAEIMQE